MEKTTITIALAGNPNSGKTTIFNNITGTRQKVGNWPGVTVEKKEGRIHKFGYDLKIIDLPGIYSLTPFSIEEIVARDYILEECPDVVIDIIDASNLERNLYLTTQLLEMEVPVVRADAAWINLGDQVEVYSEARSLTWDGTVIRKGQFVDENTQSQSIFVRIRPRPNQIVPCRSRGICSPFLMTPVLRQTVPAC